MNIQKNSVVIAYRHLRARPAGGAAAGRVRHGECPGKADKETAALPPMRARGLRARGALVALMGRHARHGMLALGAWMLMLGSPCATAGVTPEISRVVFAGNAQEQSLQVMNVNPYPVLVQAWVDDGDINGVPQEAKAPVMVLPPIFRLAPSAQASLRLINAAVQLPTDRESLFWLNLYEIPSTPKEQAHDAQTVTVTMRTQIKVFVRPEMLPESAEALPGRLAFSLAQKSDQLVLTIDNPTPYHATIGAVQVDVGDSSQNATPEMIAPFSSTTVELNTLHVGAGEKAKIQFSLIGDDGNPRIGEREVAVGG